MNWNGLIQKDLETAYKTTGKLLDLVDPDSLEWKPSAENNWMTMGQLLMHITSACGACFKGFVTGDWGMPEDFDISKMTPEEMLPPAENMPSVESVEQAKQLLAEDKQLAFDMLAQTNEEDLTAKMVFAPWDPGTEDILGRFLLQMIGHLDQHKFQLFFYLKLQGKPVNTFNLY